jgi:hypothetical protein
MPAISPPPPDRHEDRVELAAGLADDLHADRALAGDHVRIIEGMHERQVLLARQRQRMLEGRIEDIAVEHYFAAEVGHRAHLDVGRGERHDDDRTDLALARRQRHALGVVAGRGGDHTARRRGGAQVRDLVVGAAQLEGKHRLQVFALEPQLVPEALREARHRIERRFDRHFVHPGRQDTLQVVFAHGAKLKASAARRAPT